jgi:superfamily II DNA or RNA helicase
LFYLKSDGASQSKSRVGYRRETSTQLVPQLGKKIKAEKGVKQEHNTAFRKAMAGLKKIGFTKPQSEGQAAALELVHQPPATSIIVLPTSSGKSALFFSVVAMAEQQTVIVVVLFAVLVDDMVDRSQKVGLACEEWLGPDSCSEMQQLVVVSADRAVTREFRHYAKGLELNKQLAHMFFDKSHVTFTDVLYRK